MGLYKWLARISSLVWGKDLLAGQPPRAKILVDVPGCWERNVDGSQPFQQYIARLKLGPLKARLAFHLRADDRWAIGVIINGRLVGWMPSTEGTDDPVVLWLRQLEAVHLVPRLAGACQMHGRKKRIVLYMPSEDDLPVLTEQMLSAEAARRSSEETSA